MYAATLSMQLPCPISLVDEEMDGKVIQQTYDTCSAPNCLRDVIPKYGQCVKVYNFIKQAIDSTYQSLNESVETPSLPPSRTSTPLHNKSIVQVYIYIHVCMLQSDMQLDRFKASFDLVNQLRGRLTVSTTSAIHPAGFEY